MTGPSWGDEIAETADRLGSRVRLATPDDLRAIGISRGVVRAVGAPMDPPPGEDGRRGQRPLPDAPDELDDPVTVAMIAERCGVTANALIAWKRSDFPAPVVEGARGVAAWWEWADVAEWLETNRPTYLTEYQRRTNP